MEEENINELNEVNEATASRSVFKNNTGLFVVILFCAWLIAMSIVIAGWLISRQIALNTTETKPTTQNTSESNEPIKPQKVSFEIPVSAPVLGNKDAKVTIAIFADFQCPFCGKWQQDLYPKLKAKYIDTGLANFSYIDFAFLGDESIQAAKAAHCANEQGKFWEYHDALFENQDGENRGGFTKSKLDSFAKKLKLDLNTFNTCMLNKDYEGILNQNLQLGQSIVVDSTPTVFINGNRFEGIPSFSEYEQLIDSELNQ